MKKSFLLLLVTAVCFNLKAQDSVTVRDYERAQKFLSTNTFSLVDNLTINPVWISGSQFWYLEKHGATVRYFVVDGRKKTKAPAFDNQRLATAMATLQRKPISVEDLIISNVRFSADMKQMTFSTQDKTWQYNTVSDELKALDDKPKPASNLRRTSGTISPDGKMQAFIRDHNLWIRELANGKEYALTTDGMEDYGYATDNAGWRRSSEPVLLWSHDSKKIATFQQDERNVGEMYLVTTNVGHPTLERWKYPLAGDSIVAMIERVIIHVDAKQPKVVRLKIPADYHRATLGDDIKANGVLADAQWSDDNNTLAFVSSSRDHKVAQFRLADAATGTVKEVFEERVPTQYESGQAAISWHYLPATHEVIWYSERDDYGHLYLYDIRTGTLKNQITRGKYVVSNLERVDVKNRKVYFMATGLDAKNPYFQHLCVANFNGTGFKDLTPEEGHHTVTFSPSYDFFVDTYSQVDQPPVMNLRNTRGDKILHLTEANADRLKAIGWKAPTTFVAKAADGQTDIYGLMFLPTNFDANKKYPLVNYIYPGPQAGSVRYWGFIASRSDHQALAELGFVVVAIDGTSNPMRTKSFQDMSYGNMAENTLPDQVGAIRQLAKQHAFIDTNRIGIWGHSGGGFATADAMFTYPDFFKVGVAQAGNHDNRNYEDDWGERYIGLVERNADGSSNYSHQANQVHAHNLKGKLMLVHGMMDDNVPPYNTLLVVKALQDANKDFDLVMFPDSRHGFGRYNNYMTRLRWDYFVRHLKGALHPKEFEVGLSD